MKYNNMIKWGALTGIWGLALLIPIGMLWSILLPILGCIITLGVGVMATGMILSSYDRS